MPDSHAPAPASSAAEPDLGYRAKGFYYGGKWEAPATSNTFVSTSPSTGKLLATVPLAGAEDVDRAVKAAAARGLTFQVELTGFFQGAFSGAPSHAEPAGRVDSVTSVRV